MALMISYMSLNEKLNEMKDLIRKTRIETEILESSNHELSKSWNSLAANEYIKKTKQDITFIRIILLAMGGKIREIKEIMKRADNAERRVYNLMEEM